MRKNWVGLIVLLGIGLLIGSYFGIRENVSANGSSAKQATISRSSVAEKELIINGVKYSYVEYSDKYESYYDLMAVNDSLQIYLNDENQAYLVDTTTSQIKYYVADAVEIPFKNGGCNENELIESAKKFICKLYGENAIKGEWEIIETEFGMYRVYMPLWVDEDNFANVFTVNITCDGIIKSASCYYELVAQSNNKAISEENAKSVALRALENKLGEDVDKYKISSVNISCGAVYGYVWYVECIKDDSSYVSGFTLVINAYTGEVMDSIPLK